MKTTYRRQFNLDKIIDEIRSKRDPYLTKCGLTPDDLWVLIDRDIHSALLDYPKRVSEGDDRITRQCILGMYAIHDTMKEIWVIPKHRLPEEEEQYEQAKAKLRKRGLGY